MAQKDSRIDDYIAAAAPFARPILKQLRRAIHAGCPEVIETLKWSMPSFEHHGILCSMAAFKAHCTFGFWKDGLVRQRQGAPAEKVLERLRRIAAADELPSMAVVTRLVAAAAVLNKQGIKRTAPEKAAPRKPLQAPADLRTALAKVKRAKATFDAFSPTNKREYIEWITEAKRDETRRRRIDQAVAWMAEGKVKNWKYIR